MEPTCSYSSRWQNREQTPTRSTVRLVAELDKGGALVSQALLDRSRAGSRYQVVNGLQSTGGFGGRADQLAEGFTYYRDPNHVNTVLARHDAVTVAQLKRLAASRSFRQIAFAGVRAQAQGCRYQRRTN